MFSWYRTPICSTETLAYSTEIKIGITNSASKTACFGSRSNGSVFVLDLIWRSAYSYRSYIFLYSIEAYGNDLNQLFQRNFYYKKKAVLNIIPGIINALKCEPYLSFTVYLELSLLLFSPTSPSGPVTRNHHCYNYRCLFSSYKKKVT